MRGSSLFAVLALVIVLGLGGKVIYDKTRGLRNNNPGNLRRDPRNHWQGESPTQTDPLYVQFVTPEDGIRALAITLKNYIRLDGVRTLNEMISRWAPGNENDTAAYIADVSNRTGIAGNQVVTLADLPAIVSAITVHENGIDPYPASVMDAGLQAAGVMLA